MTTTISKPIERSAQFESRLDAIIEPLRATARVPGLGIAIVANGEVLLAKGYGSRDLDGMLPMTAQTRYPIASTTKAFNATLLGMLVDEGRLAWDALVQDYLPSFRISDPTTSAQITLRDLVTMRTGLPRHDWTWTGSECSCADLVERLRYLPVSARLRERYQYNNLTTITAGYLAEIVTGKTWEELVQSRIFEPLEMTDSSFRLSDIGNVTRSYHENVRRELVPTQRLRTEAIAAAGGSINSTILDMAKWVRFNLNEGSVGQKALISARTLAEIQSPQVMSGSDTASPSQGAPYAMGWFVDSYNGFARTSHGGYLHDVNSEVMLFPQQDVGVVCFVNFGPPRLARVFGQYAFDVLMNQDSAQKLDTTLAAYETKVEENRRRLLSVRRVDGTRPSRGLEHYAGAYQHPGYGRMMIEQNDGTLTLRFNGLKLLLEHWHYDVWVVAENELFAIHQPHAFDRSNRVVFESDADGEIAALLIQLEPAVAPLLFAKQSVATL